MLTVVILFMRLLTNSMDNFLTLLNVDGINNFLASCLGDLARVFMRMLVTLLFLLVFTLRTSVMMSSRLCRTLVIIILTIVILMIFTHNPRIVSNNTRMMIVSFLVFMTISSCNILTLLNVGYIYNNFVINITFLMLLLFGDLMALLILLVMTMRTIMMLILNMTLMTRLSSNIHKSDGQDYS